MLGQTGAGFVERHEGHVGAGDCHALGLIRKMARGADQSRKTPAAQMRRRDKFSLDIRHCQYDRFNMIHFDVMPKTRVFRVGVQHPPPSPTMEFDFPWIRVQTHDPLPALAQKIIRGATGATHAENHDMGLTQDNGLLVRVALGQFEGIEP
jgi:hypothetical protein